MGYSLAVAFAKGGYSVYLIDVNEDILIKANRLLEASLMMYEQQGLIKEGNAILIHNRIKTTAQVEDLPKNAGLIVEAIIKDENTKRTLYDQIDQLFDSDAIIASNTSYLNVFELAYISHPERFLITHWFAPPDIIPVVEVVKGPKTSTETVNNIRAILVGIGKKPIIVEKYIPGFIVNRLQRVIEKEGFHLLDNQIATPEQIDEAVKYSIGFRIPIIGVVQRYDFTGLDFSLMTQEIRSYPRSLRRDL
jgi:3-hydroxyacyl-CoA dehydrogenase